MFSLFSEEKCVDSVVVFLFYFYLIYHKIQITIRQDSYTKANESGEEAQKKP